MKNWHLVVEVEDVETASFPVKMIQMNKVFDAPPPDYSSRPYTSLQDKRSVPASTPALRGVTITSSGRKIVSRSHKCFLTQYHLAASFDTTQHVSTLQFKGDSVTYNLISTPCQWADVA